MTRRFPFTERELSWVAGHITRIVIHLPHIIAQLPHIIAQLPHIITHLPRIVAHLTCVIIQLFHMASFSGASTPASNQFTINFQDCINQLITLRDSDLLPVRDSEVSAICLFLQEVVAIIYRFQAHSQTHPQIPATISIYPNEISYVSAADANRQLTLTHERQSAAGVVQESPEELKSHIRDAGKLNIACSHFYKAKAINLFLFRASPPLNFMAAKRDGWFDGLQGSDAEWEVLYHNRTVPYRSLAVKITEHVVS